MSQKEELTTAARLYYLPMQLTVYSLPPRNKAETGLNFPAGGKQAEFIVDLAHLSAFCTRGNWKFRGFFPLVSLF